MINIKSKQNIKVKTFEKYRGLIPMSQKKEVMEYLRSL